MLRKFGSTAVAFFVVLGIIAGVVIYLAISSSRSTVIKGNLIEAPSPCRFTVSS